MNPDVPVPKYRLHQKVWEANTNWRQSADHINCKHCDGVGVFSAIVGPSKQVIRSNCNACNGRGKHWIYRFGEGLAKRLTIGSIRIDTAERDGRDKITYMCKETGVGSGNVYQESRLSETEEKAKEQSRILSIAANIQYNETHILREDGIWVEKPDIPRNWDHYRWDD